MYRASNHYRNGVTGVGLNVAHLSLKVDHEGF